MSKDSQQDAAAAAAEFKIQLGGLIEFRGRFEKSGRGGAEVFQLMWAERFSAGE